MSTTEATPAGTAAGYAVSCAKCIDLQRELEAAERARDRTRAVDCRVLLRRHPRHDGVPVEAGA
ncbi:hypothetical protein Sgleb_11990 [Streptomyces glebosus]|uniref:Uncharacterized protein n=1 Tax=Streptomyces glebosus TaxID=249580 RepID=A0A640SQR5_9ACTN|nr:hypothetical protein Sgleb_11990 [Streptomyces glebosus]GHG78483.1 hypothetical protein GCM10010513_54940 [Streptomyces glebosus]